MCVLERQQPKLADSYDGENSPPHEEGNCPLLSPADRLSFDLLVQPGIERLEIIENGGRVHLLCPGNLFERVRPGARQAPRKHCVQPLAGLGTFINRATMDRQRAACGLRKRAMKLELKNERKKVTRVRHIRRDVILRTRIEKFFPARADRSDSLILQSQIPPRFVVILRLDLSGKN